MRAPGGPWSKFDFLFSPYVLPNEHESMEDSQ